MTRFFYWDRIGGHLLPRQDEVAFVVNRPLHHLALGKIEGLGERASGSDVELSAFLALDALTLVG